MRRSKSGQQRKQDEDQSRMVSVLDKRRLIYTLFSESRG